MDDHREILESDDPRIICFERADDQAAVERSLTMMLSALQQEHRSLFVNEHNILRMNHGRSWVHSAREDIENSEMQTISTEWMIPFKEVAENDLSLIARTIKPITEEMQRQFAENMYDTVGAAAKKVGNVVDAKATRSFAETMLETFKKIEFGVDRDGNVSMPQLHVNPETYKRIAADLQSVPEDIEREIELVKAEKVQAALKRDAERKAKFKSREA